ncbi:hypothetical protein GYMLUDRAFT_248727 [Collybiopsis luxurians FD-317 M1]|uniref:DNA 3'-5' helicase n=1 Tax=Collybiopsis luxurians FD-317 M1 TaxID=944289 RepID=A0A0D0CB90_9AGAR|nr:hypothetical protein GYMLUDRAFT_248727 [Collybiopsis luxurians FD-317 M1]
MNSVGSPLHIFGILETGAGKSLAFFGAPFLMPTKFFLVVSPLVTLTSDLKHHLLDVGINGGVYRTDSFYRWISSHSLKLQLGQIFIDKVHKILTDKHFHQCFQLFHRLTAVGVPITFLSGSLMPCAMPHILREMRISDMLLVDEICHYTGCPNLKYIVEKQFESDNDVIPQITSLVKEVTTNMKLGERGIIYVSTVAHAQSISEMLGCQIYTGRLNPQARALAEGLWHEGLDPKDCWMVATEAFGQGVDYAHVQYTVHENPKGLLNWFQETGCAGHDNIPSTCFTIWSQLPFAVPAEDPDHGGRMEMCALFQTSDCICLACAYLSLKLDADQDPDDVIVNASFHQIINASLTKQKALNCLLIVVKDSINHAVNASTSELAILYIKNMKDIHMTSIAKGIDQDDWGLLSSKNALSKFHVDAGGAAAETFSVSKVITNESKPDCLRVMVCILIFWVKHLKQRWRRQDYKKELHHLNPAKFQHLITIIMVANLVQMAVVLDDQYYNNFIPEDVAKAYGSGDAYSKKLFKFLDKKLKLIIKMGSSPGFIKPISTFARCFLIKQSVALVKRQL